MSVKTLREQHAEATRTALISAARQLFAEKGYAATSAEEICRAAQVTRGALYHHFKDKKDLFGAVADVVSTELTDKVREASFAQITPDVADPRPALMIGCHAFLDACMEGDFHRIVILEAPSVVGWNEWREHAEGHELELMQLALRIGMDAGVIEEQPVDVLAPLLMAVLNEGAMLIARAKNKKAMRAVVGDTIDRIFDGLDSEKGRALNAQRDIS